MLFLQCSFLCFVCAAAFGVSKKNLLFLVSEDLRYENFEAMWALPNFRKLLQDGLSFDLAYCQVAVCAPSRASLLTGLRPDKTGIFDFTHFGGIRWFRTIPSHLQRKGYQTAMSGKLFHWEASMHYSSGYWGYPQWEAMQKDEARFINSSVTPDGVDSKRDDTSFRDSVVVSQALKFLYLMNNKSTETGQPWFLGVGFKGTHIPYHMPRKYWDAVKALDWTASPHTTRFPSDTSLIGHVTRTENTAVRFMNNEGRLPAVDVERYQKSGSGLEISVRGWKELYRGYLACLAFLDAQIGRVLSALELLQLKNSTLIVFTSDHGMHVGEKGIWGKWTLFEESAHVPLVIRDPTYPLSFGKRFPHPVELVDLFPTVVDLLDVPLETQIECDRWTQTTLDLAPTGRSIGSESRLEWTEALKELGKRNKKALATHVFCDGLSGSSLRHAFSQATTGNSNRFAVTQKITCKNPGNLDLNPNSSGWTDFCPFKKLPRDPPFGAMGYSVRTKDWRYTAWVKVNVSSLLPLIPEQPLAEELYDHGGDTDEVASRDRELVNLVKDAKYSEWLEAGRKVLLDFLRRNNSYEHLYHCRVHPVKLRSIAEGRCHETQ